MLAPKASLNAGLPDPLATGAIAARPNTLSAIQAGAQVLAVKELAAKGDAAAQFDYAARLVEGRGIGQDKVAAIGWFEKAAAQGLAQAQYRLGAIYEKGLGLPRDPVKARDYYEKAANQGNVRAMHNLAVILAEGIDGKPDYSAAATWFRRAADYGVRDSQFNLAILYARGMGVPQNLGQSYVWFAAAALQGDEDAAKKRDEVGAQLDATAREAAKKQVAEFHARTPASAVNEPPAVRPARGPRPPRCRPPSARRCRSSETARPGVQSLPEMRVDVRAAAAELALQRFKAAIEVIDALDHAFALGDERRDHQRDRGAQIRRHDRRALQHRHALDDRAVAFEPDMGAETRQFLHVHEAVFENRLGDARDALRLGHQRHELRLKIGREAGEGGGDDVDRPDRLAIAGDANAVAIGLDAGAGRDDRVERGLQMLGRAPCRKTSPPVIAAAMA